MRSDGNSGFTALRRYRVGKRMLRIDRPDGEFAREYAFVAAFHLHNCVVHLEQLRSGKLERKLRRLVSSAHG